MTEATYLGVVYGTLAALRRMLPRNRRAIIQVGSALTYRGMPLKAASTAAQSMPSKGSPRPTRRIVA